MTSKQRTIPLTQGFSAIVDEGDYADLLHFRWRAMVDRRKDGSIRTVYAVCDVQHPNGKRLPQRMHRVLLPDSLQVDHIDGDGLNNRRANLRAATQAENNRNARRRSNNTSGFRGVFWDARRQHWRARIEGSQNGQRWSRSLGVFNTAHEAAWAYDQAAIELFGVFAYLNFPVYAS